MESVSGQFPWTSVLDYSQSSVSFQHHGQRPAALLFFSVVSGQALPITENTSFHGVTHKTISLLGLGKNPNIWYDRKKKSKIEV